MMLCGISRADESVYEINIPAMNAAEALNRFAEQTGTIMLFPYDLASARQANAVSGRYTLLEGLELLLQDTGLSGGLSDKRVVNISHQGNGQRNKREGDDMGRAQKKGILAGLASAVLAVLGAQSATGQEIAADQATRVSPVLEEIIVTAQKREERLQDVPIPLTAVDTQALLGTNQLRLQDFYSTIPGLNYSPGQWGEPRIAIRGVVTSAYTNPTVGIMVDDIPYGLSTNQNGGGAPDIDPADLARIEVLRGPQGTLYGASSMGGLIKYVTLDPSTDALAGRIHIGGSSVSGGGDLGYNVRAAVNVPLSDTFAIRASAFTRSEPGFIDNVQTGENDVNDIDAQGGRLAALWQISDSVTLKLSALSQNSEMNGSNIVEPGLGDLRHSLLPTAGQYERGSEVYTANLIASFDTIEFVSLTGYNADSFAGGIDITGALGFVSDLFYGVPYAFYSIDQDTSKFTQEFRLSMPLGDMFDWRVGAFYTDEDVDTPQQLSAVDGNAQFVGNFLDTGIARVNYEEYALFSDLMVQITERFNVQIGARQAWIEQRNYAQEQTGPFAGPATPDLRNSDDALTYLLTPQLRISPDLMVYARAASGYRPGGINTYNPVLGTLPPYKPDETRNYEIGIKGSAWNQMLSFDASAYHIDWEDIQLLVTNVISYYENAGSARSRGLELSTEFRPREDWTVAAWATWGEAELTEAFPANSSAFGVAGDRLPYSPRFSGNLSLDKTFPLFDRATGSAGIAYRYVGDRAADFRPGPGVPQPELPSYSQFDFRFDVYLDAWVISTFVTNIADERGITGIAPFSINEAYNYIQPRTIGASLAWNF